MAGTPAVTVTNLQLLHSLQALHAKVDILMSQQDEINADVTELDTAFNDISAEIAALQAANPALDLTALKAKVDAIAAIAAPPAAPPAP